MPQIAFDPEGDGVAIWSREDGAHKVVQAAGLDGASPQLRGPSIPPAATMGQPISFSVSPFDSWSAIASIRWGFGDDGTAVGPAVTHVYARPGTYPVTLAVADALGKTSETSGAVTVFPKARAGRNVLLRKRRARLRVHCPSPAGCEGLAKLIAPVRVHRHRRLAKRRRTIGRARFSIPGSTTGRS